MADSRNQKKHRLPLYWEKCPGLARGRGTSFAAATANPAALWPDNHKFVAAQVAGISDGDEDPLTIRIDSIRQADGNGGVCSGAMTVGVPPSKKGTAVNDGANYDSTGVQGASSAGPVVLDKCCLLFMPVASNK